MVNIKKQTYFTELEALEWIENTLENYVIDYIDDVHFNAFNDGYYISYTNEAISALEAYGTFKAIGKIVEYEQDNFGNLHTDISDPVKVANMLWYIIGELVLYETIDLYQYDTGDIESDMERMLKKVKHLLNERNDQQ